jgi:DNA-binding transcriptional MocR family regulator
VSRLYLVSVGSNPTGITISAGRRREIYEVCKEFGAYITEHSASSCLMTKDEKT